MILKNKMLLKIIIMSIFFIIWRKSFKLIIITRENKEKLKKTQYID